MASEQKSLKTEASNICTTSERKIKNTSHNFQNWIGSQERQIFTAALNGIFALDQEWAISGLPQRFQQPTKALRKNLQI